MPYVTHDLLDRDIDLTHRSYHTAMEHAHLDPPRLLAGREILRHDDHWTDRYIS
jgi:hypothetical protein